MTLTYPVGTPLSKTQAAVDRIEQHILQIDGVASTFTTVGRKPAGWGSTLGGNVARLHASMDKKRRGETDRAVAAIRKLGYLAPGAQFTVAGDTGGGDPIYYVAVRARRPDPGRGRQTRRVHQLDPRDGQRADRRRGRRRPPQRQHRSHHAARCSASTRATRRPPRASRSAARSRPRSARRPGSSTCACNFRPSGATAWATCRTCAFARATGRCIGSRDVATFEMGKAPTKIERQDKQRVVRVTGGVDQQSGTKLGAVSAEDRRGDQHAGIPADRRRADARRATPVLRRDDEQHGHRAAHVVRARLHADGHPLRIVPDAVRHHVLGAGRDRRRARRPRLDGSDAQPVLDDRHHHALRPRREERHPAGRLREHDAPTRPARARRRCARRPGSGCARS